MGILGKKWHMGYEESKINLHVKPEHQPEPVKLVEHEHHYPKLKVPRLLPETKEGVYK